MPRYMLLIKASPEAEDPDATTPEIFEEMTTFNEQLHAGGVLLSGEGFRPTDVDSYRVTYSPDGPAQATKGPFDVEKEAHVCGWWILKTKDVEEALGWAKKIPFKKGEVVVRRIAEMEDFGDTVSEDVKEREKKLMAEIEKRT
ncbi:YCII domain-containing protein [Fusarium sp. LHS14.1]|nr:YCII domain-containing protein [Fusarium sp. LHS14.1]